jgi:GTP-binding protein
MIMDEHKPCLIIANKFDLYHPGAPMKERLKSLREEVYEELFFLDYAPIAATSAMDGTHLNKVFGAIEAIKKAAAEPITTGALNRFFKEALLRNPPPNQGGRRLKILYATLAKESNEDYARPIPAPRFVLFVNDAGLMSDSYQRYLEGRLREEHGLRGLPISFDFRERAPKEQAKPKAQGGGKSKPKAGGKPKPRPKPKSKPKAKPKAKR